MCRPRAALAVTCGFTGHGRTPVRTAHSPQSQDNCFTRWGSQGARSLSSVRFGRSVDEPSVGTALLFGELASIGIADGSQNPRVCSQGSGYRSTRLAQVRFAMYQSTDRASPSSIDTRGSQSSNSRAFEMFAHVAGTSNG